MRFKQAEHVKVNLLAAINYIWDETGDVSMPDRDAMVLAADYVDRELRILRRASETSRRTLEEVNRRKATELGILE